MIGAMESTIATQADHLGATLLLDIKHTGINRSWILLRDFLLWGYQFHPGDQTSGSPFAYPVDSVLEEQYGAEFFSAWASTVGKLAQGLSQLSEMEVRRQSSIGGIYLPEEIDVFARLLHPVRGVEELKALRNDTGFATWVVVNNASREIEYSIFDAEMELMTRFPRVIFDFHIVDRHGTQLSSVATLDEQTITVAIR